MTTTFPTGLDNLTNPTATDSVATIDHAAQHANANDAIKALEAKVGINSSAVTTSHDYKLSGVTGTDKAVSLTGTEALTNKTLTSPTITTPTIASFTNATHNHTNAAGGGQLTDAALSAAVTVSKGGTGQTSLTAYALLAGGTTTTGNVQSLAGVGTAGQVLTSNGAGALPTFQAVSSSGAIATSMIPRSVVPNNGYAQTTTNSNTTAFVGEITVDAPITVNKISFAVNTIAASGTVKIAIFSCDGQTKYFEVTTATISAANSIVQTAVSSITLNPGIYTIMIVPVGSTNLVGYYWNTNNNAPFGGGTINLSKDISGKNIMQGSLTVTAGTIPATFTPSSVTYVDHTTLIVRLDN